MSTSRRRPRPQLRLEMTGLGVVDPFELRVVERPPGSGRHVLEDPAREGHCAALEKSGLSLVGAGQALVGLSLRWMGEAGHALTPDPEPPFGEVRLRVRRREARLLAALLRRHLDRLPEPPGWMPDLMRSLEEIDEYLRWEER